MRTKIQRKELSTKALAIVLMGVSGSGKSEVGARLAQALIVRFIEGDRFHSPENVAKMRAGVPLGDADRRGWLANLRSEIVSAMHAGETVVVACSALKRAYRDVLRGDSNYGDVRFVHLAGEPDLLAQRMAARTGHFMPPALLRSQLCDLEALQSDEAGVTLDVRDPADRLVEHAMLSLSEPGID